MLIVRTTSRLAVTTPGEGEAGPLPGGWCLHVDGAPGPRLEVRPLSTLEYLAWSTASDEAARLDAVWVAVVALDGAAPPSWRELAGPTTLAVVALVLAASEGRAGPLG